jgi:hypothetical protein
MFIIVLILDTDYRPCHSFSLGHQGCKSAASGNDSKLSRMVDEEVVHRNSLDKVMLVT